MYSGRYSLSLGTMHCPVTPEKIQTKITGKNKTVTLINEGDVNIIKAPGLTEITFDLLLPNVEYPFAEYNNGFKTADYYLKELRRLKTDKIPFNMVLLRKFPTDKNASLLEKGLNISGIASHRVVLENYVIIDDAKNGLDVVVSIHLKQYVNYGVKTFKAKNNTVQEKKPKRETTSSPAPKKTNKTYTVKSGDCLWAIAKKFYGDGSKYNKIYEANKSVIGGNANLIYPGQVLTIPVL